MFTRRYWVDVFERATKSVAQGLLTGAAGAITIQQVDWEHVLGAGALMGLFSVLTSLASVRAGEDQESASLL